MPSKTTTLTIAGMAYVLLFAGNKARIFGSDSDDVCGGIQRWEVKVLTDESADQVETSPLDATIEEINEFPRPGVTIGKNTDRLDEEMQVYTLRNMVISKAILEDDNDIHLVLEDGDRHTMVAEIVDPECPDAAGSRFVKKFKKVRSKFLQYQHIYHNHTFTVKGVLFFDVKHKGTGHGPNHAELHPILELIPEQ